MVGMIYIYATIYYHQVINVDTIIILNYKKVEKRNLTLKKEQVKNLKNLAVDYTPMKTLKIQLVLNSKLKKT